MILNSLREVRERESIFEGCISLTSFVIPDSLTSIPFGMFFKCTGLTTVTIPDPITTIGQSRYLVCKRLKSVAILSNYVFDECKNMEYAFVPNGLSYPPEVFPATTKIKVY